MKSLHTELNFKATATMDIVLPTGTIKAGEVFDLVDAYKEGQTHVFIGIKTDSGIYEAGFLIPKTRQVGNDEQMKRFLGLFIMPWFGGAKYTVFQKNIIP
jgi:hypothetical protein